FRIDVAQDRFGFGAFAHLHDAFDDVVVVGHAPIVVTNRLAQSAEAYFRALRHYGDIADTHRGAVLGSQHSCADVIGVLHESNSANVVRLLSFLDKAAPAVQVVVGQRLFDLRHGQS